MAAPTVSYGLATWFASIIAALKAPLLVAIVAGLATGGGVHSSASGSSTVDATTPVASASVAPAADHQYPLPPSPSEEGFKSGKPYVKVPGKNLGQDEDVFFIKPIGWSWEKTPDWRYSQETRKVISAAPKGWQYPTAAAEYDGIPVVCRDGAAFVKLQTVAVPDSYVSVTLDRLSPKGESETAINRRVEPESPVTNAASGEAPQPIEFKLYHKGAENREGIYRLVINHGTVKLPFQAIDCSKVS